MNMALTSPMPAGARGSVVAWQFAHFHAAAGLVQRVALELQVVNGLKPGCSRELRETQRPAPMPLPPSKRPVPRNHCR